MITAGFDVATSTGIAIFDGDVPVHIERWFANIKRPEGLKKNQISEAHEAALKHHFRNKIRPMLVSHGVEYVAYEKPRTNDFARKPRGATGPGEEERGSSNSGLVRGVVLCAELYDIATLTLNIPSVAVTADDWRLAFLGFSRAPKHIGDYEARRAFLKAEAVRRCKLLGIKVPNDDCAEAVGVNWWLRGMLNPAMRSLFDGVAA